MTLLINRLLKLVNLVVTCFFGGQGQDIYDELRNAHSRGVTIRVVQSSPSDIYHDDDSKQLFEDNVIELRNLSVEAFLGAGILHTKLWIIDSKHFYVGSANMDWRSLTQVYCNVSKDLLIFPSYSLFRSRN